MIRRVPQPQVDPARRDPEARTFWPGFVIGALGLALFASGVRNVTAIETLNGNAAFETEVVRAFAYGGLLHVQAPPPTPPQPTGNPGLDAAAMDRWERDLANAAPAARRIRVDTGAKAACPT